MLGALMFASKALMEVFPNIHLLGTFTMVLTLVYRKKALYPLYTFIFLVGLFSGFAPWWVPYLYIWTVLWAVTMLLPRNIPAKIKSLIYMVICALHGFLYGILYAPVQALMFGLSLEGTVAWITAGLPFDFIHGISNFFCGMLINPLVSTIKRAERSSW